MTFENFVMAETRYRVTLALLTLCYADLMSTPSGSLVHLLYGSGKSACARRVRMLASNPSQIFPP